MIESPIEFIVVVVGMSAWCVCVGGGGWTLCACCNVHVDSDHSFVELVLSLDYFTGSSSGGSNSNQIMSLLRQALFVAFLWDPSSVSRFCLSFLLMFHVCVISSQSGKLTLSSNHFIDISSIPSFLFPRIFSVMSGGKGVMCGYMFRCV